MRDLAFTKSRDFRKGVGTPSSNLSATSLVHYGPGTTPEIFPKRERVFFGKPRFGWQVKGVFDPGTFASTRKTKLCEVLGLQPEPQKYVPK